MKRSKRYNKLSEIVDKTKSYYLDAAIDLIPETAKLNFDPTIEIHIKLALTEKQKKSTIRITTTLPHQSKSQQKKIAVITTPENTEKAKDADIVGYDDLIKKIQDGFSDFDIVIASPEVMQKAAVLGRVLGPRGKMPNPKNGTVTANLEKTIKTFKEGKINIRVDDEGGIHNAVGKASMTKKDLKENIITFLQAIYKETKKFQPMPFESIHLSTTMGPSINLDQKDVVDNLT